MPPDPSRTLREERTHARAAAVTFLALAIGVGVPPRAEAWGFTGHRMVNLKAIGTLPDPLRPLFAANADYVSEHAIDPDLWRAAGRADELRNHFLDMDAFGPYPFGVIPHVEAEHLAKHGKEALSKGRVPWRVDEVYRELVAAFRAGDPARVLERAAVLGHYVGDAHVPFHAAVNYDGQLTGQAGIHERWESEMVDRFERQLEAEVRPAPAHRVADPVAFVFDVLTDSYPGSLEALASDRASVGPRDLAATPQDDRYDDDYYSKMYRLEAARLRSRLSSAATALGSLWLSAWEEAGRPKLDASFRFPYVRKGARAILVTLDGSSAPILDDAVARGVMPHLARLRRAGATAQGSVTSFPAKTAAGHAAVFTGTWPNRNGIAGNQVSVPGGTVLESNSGYASTHLRAEPIWATAARQGLEATVVTATQVFPFAPYLEGRRFGGNFGWRLTLLDGYQNFEATDAVLTAKDLAFHAPEGWISGLPEHAGEPRAFEIDVAGTEVDGLLYDDPADPASGFDSLYLAMDRDKSGGITLKAGPPREDPSAFGALRVKAAGTDSAVYFRLFALSSDGKEVLLYRSAPYCLRSSRPPLEGAAFEATGGFLGNGAKDLYQAGALGPTLWQGGDGTAENRYLETVGLVARQFARLTDFGLDRTSWDLLVTYLPYPDEAFGAWLGYLDPSVPAHDPAFAERLRPLADRMLGIVDEYVGHLMTRAGSDAILAVAGDHGMIGSDRVFHPNVALARAGLLATDAKGQPDLTRTRAVYFSGNSGFVLINAAAREGGIVRPEEEEDVRRDVAKALGEVRDPSTGQPVVIGTLDPRTGGSERGIGGPTGGDLYLSLAPGYDLSARLADELVEVGQPRGVHFLDTDRPAMHAAFAVAGPGVASGVDLGVIREIDIAPTLCALLGIDPPAQATGAVLSKALARRPVRSSAP